MITDVIRNAENSNEIYFLLTSYLEALQFSGAMDRVLPHIVDLPLKDKVDLKVRFDKLMIELDCASKRLDDKACLVIKEMLHVFGTALSRLRAIDHQKQLLSVNTLKSVGIDCRT